jgi:L-fuconolactonase
MSSLLSHISIIDTHLHLWDTRSMQYPWLDSVPAINRTFLIADYQQAVQGYPVEQLVFVQAECLPEQYLEEVHFVVTQAAKDPRIRGMVAYAPVERGKQLANELDKLKSYPLVKGVRRMYDDDPALCVSSAFLEGVQLLSTYGYTFDLSVKPASIPDTIGMIGACPDTLFILDHLGKPAIQGGGLDVYKKHIDTLAKFPNVVAKLSGLITEADWHTWTAKDLAPYIQHAVDCFGVERLLFGGDWPVVLLAGTWAQWITALEEGLSFCTAADLQKIFYDNAVNIYRL